MLLSFLAASSLFLTISSTPASIAVNDVFNADAWDCASPSLTAVSNDLSDPPAAVFASVMALKSLFPTVDAAANPEFFERDSIA